MTVSEYMKLPYNYMIKPLSDESGSYFHGVVLELEKFSGKFVLRIPKSLHCRLALEAEKEGVSLNQYALYKLSL